MQNLLFLNSRKTFGVLGTSSLGLIIVALIFEHALLLKPCLLCYAQRSCVYLLLLLSLIAFLHKNKSLNLFRTYLGLSIAVIASGISLSLRQLRKAKTGIRGKQQQMNRHRHNPDAQHCTDQNQCSKS